MWRGICCEANTLRRQHCLQYKRFKKQNVLLNLNWELCAGPSGDCLSLHVCRQTQQCTSRAGTSQCRIRTRGLTVPPCNAQGCRPHSAGVTAPLQGFLPHILWSPGLPCANERRRLFLWGVRGVGWTSALVHPHPGAITQGTACSKHMASPADHTPLGLSFPF